MLRRGRSLFVLAAQGNQDAIRERLRREIMAVDNIEYDETTEPLMKMSAMVTSNHGSVMFPLRTLGWTAAIGGFGVHHSLVVAPLVLFLV